VKLFFQVLVSGLGLGAVYALFALGYSLVYGLLRLMNLAHGDVLTLGTFVGFGVLEAGVPTWLAMIVGVGSGALLALVVDQAAYRPLRASGDRLGQLIAALSIALVLRNLSTAIFGVKTKYVPPVLGEQKLRFQGLDVSAAPLASLVLGAVIIALFTLFLRRNRWGWAIQAAAEDIPTARLMGIPIARTVALVYVLSGALGVVGGILYASTYTVLFVGLGWLGTLKAFTAAILGGIGSLVGSVLGGLVLGVLEAFSAVYISSRYRDAIAFAAMIGVLVARPQGLFGHGAKERV
jgi:branched-chain amino acid transport system permease protein